MKELYHHGSSVCAAKVRIALFEKSIKWTGHYLDILKGDQFTPEYLKINPKGVVPTFVDDGKIIAESTVICEYIEECFPEPALMPQDPVARAHVRQWTKAIDEDLHPTCAAVTFSISHRHTVARLGDQGTEEFLNATPAFSVTADWATLKRMYVELGLRAPGAADKIKLYDAYLHKMETALADGPWVAGASYSLADVGLTPYVGRLAMMQMHPMWEGGRLPRVADWYDRVQARPSFTPAVLQWVPDSLMEDFRVNGTKSWPEVAQILEI